MRSLTACAFSVLCMGLSAAQTDAHLYTKISANLKVFPSMMPTPVGSCVKFDSWSSSQYFVVHVNVLYNIKYIQIHLEFHLRAILNI